MERGMIIPMYTVTCGRCDENLPFDTTVDSLRQAAYEARQFGWVNSRLYGWLCPLCQTERKREQKRQ